MAFSGGSAARERERRKQRAWQHLDQKRCQQEHTFFGAVSHDSWLERQALVY